MLFSFVIPTYNRSEKVQRAINSVLVQNNWSDHAEIIIIDDGSTDDTEDSLHDYLVKGHIKYIKHSVNAGVAQAKNTGIKHANNKYVVLLDSDDLLIEGGLDYLKKMVLRNDYDVFFFGTKTLNRGKLMFDPDFYGLKSYFDFLKTKVGEYLPVLRSNLIQNNLLKNLRGYESITWLNLSRNGAKIFFDSVAIRLYDNEGDDRISNRFNGIKNSRNMRDGYQLFLKEFSSDLKTHNYPEYLKLRLKLYSYQILASFIV